MGGYGSDINLNVRAIGVDATNQQLKEIADAVRQIAGSTRLSTDALNQIRSALGQNSQVAGQFANVIQQVTDNLVGIRTGVEALAELQGEANAARERLSEAAKEAARLRQELAEQRKELEELKKSQQAITQAVSNPMKFAADQVLNLTRALGPIPAMLSAIAIGFGTVAVGAFEMVKAFGSDAREAENLANRFGLTTAQAMRLRAEAQLVEVNIRTVEFAARQLAGALEDPTGSGKKAADALERIGIKLRDFGGAARELGPVFLEVLDHLKGITNTAERVREAQVLLGRSAKELEPLIVNHEKLAKTVDELRLHMDKATTDTLLNANLKVNALTQSLKDLGRQMAAKLSTVVVPIVEIITRKFQEERKPSQAEIEQNSAKAIPGRSNSDHLKLDFPEESFGPRKPKGVGPIDPSSPAVLDTAGDKGITDAIAQGKSIAHSTVEKYKKTVDGLRDELKDLHEERAKLLNEIKEIDKYGGSPSSATSKQKRLNEIEAREAAIEASLRPKAHDQAKERMIEIEHERARLQLEVNQAYWKRLHADDEAGIRERATNLLKYNKAISDDEIKEAQQKIAIMSKSDKDYAVHKATIELQIEKIRTHAAERAVEIETERDNKIKDIHDREAKNLNEFFEHTQKAWLTAQEKIVKAEGDRLSKEAKAQEQREKNAKNHADRMIKIQETYINFLANIGVINEDERNRRLNELYKKQEEDDIRHIQRSIEIAKADPHGSPKSIEELEGQLQAVMDRRNERAQAADEQQIQTKMRRWEKGFNALGNAFDQTVTGMVMRGEGFGVAWRKVVGNMVTDFEVGLIKMGLNWVKHQVAKVILHQTANTAIVASDAQASAARRGISLRDHFREVYLTAKQVAIKAYKALADVPIIGPTILGPAAAAASFAAVMAIGMVSAEKGAILPNKETVGFLHPREMVLPAPISQGLQAAISGGTFANGAPGGSGSFVFAPRVSAFDSKGVDRVLMEHGKKFMEFFQQQRRDGHV